jgi:peroxiredoxin
MKKMIASLATALLILTLSVTTFGQRADNAAQPRREPAWRPGTEQAQQAQKLQQQIEQMRTAHQELIDRLNAIRATAAQEKAQRTVSQIDAFISQRQTAFQASLRPLEQELQQLQRALRSRTGRPDQGGLRARRAPAFELDSFDGRQVKLADYRGQIVVLEWLNPDSPSCRYHYETARTMVTLANKYRDKGVVWLAIDSSVRTTPQANREFAEKYQLPYPILDDRPGDVARRYGARTTPHLFIIDKEGRIAYDGAIDDAPAQGQPAAGKVNYVDKALAELTLNRKVSLPNTPPYGTPIQYGK